MALPAAQQIHILGLGNLGKLVAHALGTVVPPSRITLLFHRTDLISSWDQAEQSIEVVTNGVSDVRKVFETEQISTADGLKRSIIDNLIVATKTYMTVEALRPLRPRLGPTSTLLFLQNGMGQYYALLDCALLSSSGGLLMASQVLSRMSPKSCSLNQLVDRNT